jgi:hypothetical protein
MSLPLAKFTLAVSRTAGQIGRRFSVIIFLLAMCSVQAGNVNSYRKPLESVVDKEVKYRPTGTRLREDPTTKQFVEYAVNGKIQFDEHTHTYLLEWMGIDGQKKKIAWIPPNKINAVVAGAVRYDARTRLFEYSYEIASLRKSAQKLQSFYVSSETEVSTGANPDATWYSSAFTPYLRRVFKSTDGWTWSQTKNDRLGLEPGESTTGFKLRSSGLPTVGQCYARGHTEGLDGSEDIPEELMDAIDRAAWNIPHGRTITPGLTSDKLSTQAIIENVYRGMEVADQEGWLAKSYDAKDLRTSIEGLRRAVNSESFDEALRIAKRTAALVDNASKHGLILSELDGLLTCNLDFLIERIASTTQR